MSWSKTYTGDEPVRVNKWMGQTGVCSRREAEALIAEGLVSIDGETVGDVGRKILPGQTLSIAEAGKSQLDSRFTVIINKPPGIVSAHPEPGQVPAIRLLTREALVGGSDIIPDDTMSLAPVGRLDMESRGLLVLSDDGVLAKALIGPQSGIEKEYLVAIEGIITDWALEKLRHGLVLDGRELKPAIVDVIGRYRLRFVLQEGRNRQIRRMCEAVGLYVVDLLRIRIGSLHLGDLPEGKWRVMTSAERAGLIAGKSSLD
ncbi:23S rRNA pseudouridine(2604) synthase [Candidatus Phycosocius bacilliformis]|uniref:Pseudouridine synthase n=1 Tax=Candidatus Phycosocius bacilliformis TaxID=1445552 RepID=A0A2P2E9J2_9PROT|nr:pseudouridine synthase [Candidatus Phycosocius bacilliformis]GBF57740.1 23S rRNA pseudouridine(2604) synthase [Candidatus Phycosocius bacilliformis]